MEHRRARDAVLRPLKLSYLLLLVSLLAWALLSYPQAATGYKELWSGVPLVNSLDTPLHNPLILLESRAEGDRLIVRLLRTYAEPGAEELLLVVKLHSSESGTVVMEVRKRVALGAWVSFVFPLTFRGESLAGCMVEVYLSGRLVAAREGC